ncbi:MAG: AAA family ATPase [Verrucomicrobiota bacterium]
MGKSKDNDAGTPRWMRDLRRFLPLRSQFVLWGNVRDRFAWHQGEHVLPLGLAEYLAAHLAQNGVPHFLSFTIAEGLRIVPRLGMELDKEKEFYAERFGLKWSEDEDVLPMSNDAFFTLMGRLSQNDEEPVGLAVDMASRLIVRDEAISDCEHGLFTKALLFSQRARPLAAFGEEESPSPRFNAVFWLLDREGDLPDWLVLENPRLRSIPIPVPDSGLRKVFIKALCREGRVSDETVDDFVDQTEGMRLADLLGIVQLCRAEGLDFSELPEGARRYKLGVTEDPWKKIDHDKIAKADEFVRKRVMGQDRAVTAMLDIVKRAVMGFSGSGKRSGRPRGVAFLAGPTGVGKTELAKTVTELLFGDERAYIRFDMSEFSAEHSDQRLIGAPPGYVGYDSGGELTNAIRERPFSLVLFDEIEKAHPKILDKFLQILDDGVLTSGRGERVYFSEAVIVFTSNLGIYQMEPDGTRRLSVTSDDDYETVESRVKTGIENFFKLELGRPEILNRLGENILVFDFIRPQVGEAIFGFMLKKILADLESATGIAIEMSELARKTLLGICLADLSNGGRGIRNQLEARLVNPLARALFDGNFTSGDRAQVWSVAVAPDLPLVELMK